MKMKALIFNFNGKSWTLGTRPLLMGVLNVTPDSFSDGGLYLNCETALEHALQMARSGADLLDIGGESTRPGAEPVPADIEKKRVLPVIKELASKTQIPLSVDTSKPSVAQAAIEAGASIINDVTGMRDPGMKEILKNSEAGFILMHMRGTPKTMQEHTEYKDLISDITDYFQERLQAIYRAGISRNRIVLDPGIGFSKTAEQNLQILANLTEFRKLGRPVLAGPSRKSFIAHLLTDKDEERRRWGTAGSVAAAVMTGADIIRVHDIAEMRDVLTVATAIRNRVKRQETGNHNA